MIRYRIQQCLMVWVGFSSLMSSAVKADLVHPVNGSVAPIFENKCVHAKGVSSIEGITEGFARQLAIRDALKNASMQSNLQVSSQHEVSNFTLIKETERFTTHSKVQKYKITYDGHQPFHEEDKYDLYGVEIKDAEKHANETYVVEMDVCLTEDPNACSKTPGNQYQLKLAVAQIAIDPSQIRQANDISHFLTGYQLEVDRRLGLLGYANRVMLQSGSALMPTQIMTPNLSPDVLNPIRDKTGAQYLLLTVVRSVSKHNDDDFLNGIKRFYNHQVEANSRFIEVDWYLVDLMSHEIVKTDRLGFNVKGDVLVGRTKPFGTSAFFSTDTGMVFHALLEQQVRKVSESLTCQPLETQIIDVRGKSYIIYLSSLSGAQVGDTLSVYHKFGANIRFQGVDLGVDSEPVGFLKIKRLHAKFAVAEIEGKKGSIQLGDIVKAW